MYEKMVSVCMITYNHEKYIRQAIDSILMQRVNFEYEIVIGDDCSLDDTKDIILEYKKKHPEIIVAVIRDKNIGANNNVYDVLNNCRGKYIAYLEGDDFWNDPIKLQKQVDFLEIHSDFIGIVHSCNVLADNADAKDSLERAYRRKEGTIYSFDSFKKNRFPGHTCTMLHRNIYLNPKHDYSIIYTADKNTGDRTMFMLLAVQGNIYCMEEAMSTYRLVCKEGASNINSMYMGQNRKFLDWQYESRLNDYCIKTFAKDFLTRERLASYWVSALKYYVMQRSVHNKEVLNEFNRLIYNKPMIFLWYIPKSLYTKIISIVYKVVRGKEK